MPRTTLPTVEWHATDLAEVLDAVAATEHGLTGDEARARLQRHGRNRMPVSKPVPLWRIFLRQFHNPLIYILAAAATVSIAIGERTDALFIAAVLLLNAVIGSVQEWRADRSSRALQRLLRGIATVVRDDASREIDAEEVVPGDVVWLESGNRVPADMRLVSAHGLEIDESLLTGESLAVLKDSAWAGAASAPVGDRRNMAFAGSMVVRGRGKGVVVSTGSHTLVGALARDVTGAPSGTPPLLVRVERFTRVIGVIVLLAAIASGAIGVLGRGFSMSDMFLFAVALAVSAIPEGLPVAMTVALSVAASRMARRGVVVRRLAAVEGLGSCTLIASDKTGTLTCNELTVVRLCLPSGEEIELTGEGYQPDGEARAAGQVVPPRSRPELDALARAALLCNEAQLHQHDGAWTWRGDPTDVALLVAGHKLGWVREQALDESPQVNEIPFEPERKYAATFHRDGEGTRVFVKGAPERVMAMCALAPDEVARAHELAAALAARGYRVLALASGATGPVAERDTPPEPTDLALLGFTAMIDPLRPGVREAVQQCQSAGIKVSMVTGDHPITARAIARDLGMEIGADEVISGAELTGKSEDELAAITRRVRVFARVSPRQKLEIVQAARACGDFVAVTGDGVNDAAALRAANIGVAMGKSGTDVAREAAELVISDDNFATIVAGVEEGRVAYDNIRKVIYLLISTGAAEVVLVLLSLIMGLPLPLTAVQLLWLNLVTNGIQHVALAFEPREDDVLRRPPRSPREPIFNRLMIERTVLAAVVMGGLGFITFERLLAAGWSEWEARGALLLLMVLFENVHVGNSRSETVSLFKLSPLRSPLLVMGTLLAFSIHFVAMHVEPTQRLLTTGPLGLNTWLMLGGLALLLAVAMEIHKWTWAIRARAR